MGSHRAYGLACLAVFAVISKHNMIFPVKGQCTVQGCENGDSSISIVAEIQQLCVETIRQQQNQQVQSIHELLNASFQQNKNQQDTVLISLQAFYRRSQEQDINIKEVESNHAFLNASFQQIKNRLENVMRSLQAVDQRLHEHDISITNKTLNSWKREIVYGIDLGEVPILPSTVNDWIVLMHRFDGSLNFSRNWTEYKNGFGDIRRGEFWLGNEKIHRLTNRFLYTLRIEVQLNTTGRWYYADYSTFSLDSEDNKYAIRLSGFSGNAGDPLTNISDSRSGGYHGGRNFSTPDADNDSFSDYNCAHVWSAGWWFDRCWKSCLTCRYGNHFKWCGHNGWQTSGLLQAARMKIKSI